MIDIVLLNRSGHISTADLMAAMVAFQTQITRDFAPVWNGDAKLWDEDEAVPARAWKCWLQDGLDQANDLGYHEDDTGTPEMKVDIAGAIGSGNDWRTVVSHELLEALADPTCTRMAGAYIVEVADPVEESLYLIDGLAVSNFVLPAYFSLDGGTKFDFNGQLTSMVPALLSGGYQMELQGNQWVSHFAHLGDGSLPWMATRPRGRRAYRIGKAATP